MNNKKFEYTRMSASVALSYHFLKYKGISTKLWSKLYRSSFWNAGVRVEPLFHEERIDWIKTENHIMQRLGNKILKYIIIE